MLLDMPVRVPAEVAPGIRCLGREMAHAAAARAQDHDHADRNGLAIWMAISRSRLTLPRISHEGAEQHGMHDDASDGRRQHRWRKTEMI